jgi:glyoxylase-like metal-dependent hydrolase (beta-lactamase superfamily II)
MAKIYHLDCGPMRPIWPKLEAATYVLLVESNHGWMLIDSGFGKKDLSSRPPIIMRIFRRMVRVAPNPASSAYAQIEKLGINPRDVSDIILTHMHLDHAGGLADFPWANVHVYENEFEAAQHHRGRIGIGYIKSQWAHNPHWVLYQRCDSEWFNLPAILVKNIEPRVYMIPMVGHTIGHCMVAVQDGNHWLLHCGDAAYPFYLQDSERTINPPDFLVNGVLGLHVHTLQNLIDQYGDQITLFSSHDSVSLEKNKKLEPV